MRHVPVTSSVKRIVAIVGLELYAVAFALVQLQGGLHTDEAKYLLNIPYPHPPLVRWVLSLTEIWPFQEVFWRVVFATMLVQAVWLVWDMTRGVALRFVPSIFWITSAGVVLLIGRIFMAPLTAVQGLVFLWLLSRIELANRYPGLIALFWLASLFTAYQAILYLPIVAVLFWRMDLKPWQKVSGILGPIALLALYSATNPHAVLSFMRGGTANASVDAAWNFRRALEVWGVGGSVILSIFGTLAAVRSRSPVIAVLALVFVFIMVSYRPYYAVLFTPLFIAGLLSHPQILCRPLSKVVLHVLVTILIVTSSGFALLREKSPAREVSEAIVSQALAAETSGSPLRRQFLLISGPFGHEWQYESPWPVRRFKENLVDDAVAVVCLEKCKLVGAGFERGDVGGVEVWMRNES